MILSKVTNCINNVVNTPINIITAVLNTQTLIANNNTRIGQELISPHQAIGVFTTRQIDLQQTPSLLDLILINSNPCLIT
jgi:hypothetical protein